MLNRITRIATPRLQIAGIVFAAFLMTACDSAQQANNSDKPQPKPASPETGRVAFQNLYLAAHGWAPDVQAFQLESEINGDSKGQDGKSAIWRASFASPQKRTEKLYVWSGTDSSDAPERGISPASEGSYNPGNTSTQVFNIAFLKVDSDQALKVAQEHGGEKVLKQAPDTPVIQELDWNRNSNKLLWHVIYGPSAGQAKLRVAVDATTGSFVRVEQ